MDLKWVRWLTTGEGGNMSGNGAQNKADSVPDPLTASIRQYLTNRGFIFHGEFSIHRIEGSIAGICKLNVQESNSHT